MAPTGLPERVANEQCGAHEVGLAALHLQFAIGNAEAGEYFVYFGTQS